nr:hypothetical protein [uncultured Flavobacterium sp.]
MKVKVLQTINKNLKFNKLKKIKHLIYFLFFLHTTYAQQNFDLNNFKVIINPDALLLGTFSEEINRFYAVDKENQIDNYKKQEKSIVNYIQFFTKNNYKLDTELKQTENGNFELYQTKLAQRLNTSYYDETGNIKVEALDSEPKLYSFLLGVYYRYGEKLPDEYYKIRLTNSGKSKNILPVLRSLNCNKLVYKATDTYPKIVEVYFKASPEMEKYFDYLKNEKSQLEFERMDFIETSKTKKEKKEILKSLQLILN